MRHPKRERKFQLAKLLKAKKKVENRIDKLRYRLEFINETIKMAEKVVSYDKIVDVSTSSPSA